MRELGSPSARGPGCATASKRVDAAVVWVFSALLLAFGVIGYNAAVHWLRLPSRIGKVFAP